MKKIIFFLLFFVGISLAQNDTLTVPENDVESVVIEVQPKHFTPEFKDKYDSREFNYNPIEEIPSDKLSAWERFKRIVIAFFRDLFDFGTANGSVSTLNIIMKIIAFFIIGFVIFMIVKIFINKEGGWVFGTSSKKINVSELVEENIHTINFKQLIQKSKNEKEFRISIRYYYLWFLKTLSDKDIIEWDIEKTNSDYFYEINNYDLKMEFKQLSYIYEYCWYGDFALNENDFSKAENSFLKAIKSL